MVNINFVPDDYIQNSESRRTNFLYIVLLVLVMAGLLGSFATIKIRQGAIDNKEKLVNAKLSQAQEAIKQFEQLQARRRAMMKTALTTAELLEPIPKSILLAALTNDLPPGVSLVRVKLLQKQVKQAASESANQYQQAQAAKSAVAETMVSREKLLETHIDVEGIAPSDRQVAAYIESLGNSNLLVNVALVESKEHKIEDTAFRRFKLAAMLKKEIHLTKEDIEKIRTKNENKPLTF